MAMRHRRATAHLLAWGILLASAVGFGLRLHELGRAGLWHDEASSWEIARRELPSLLAAAAAVEHPPVFFLLLHGWMGLAGTSEFALRLPAAFAGTLTLPLLATLARLLSTGSGRAARCYPLLTAILVASSPWLVWHSRQVRMYPLALALVALASVLGLLALRHGRAWRWGALAVVSALAVGSHLLAALPLAGLAVGLSGLALAQRCWRRGALALLSVASGLAVVLPWVLTARGLSAENASYFRGPLDRSSVLLESLLALTAGTGQLSRPALLLTGAGVLLLLAGLTWLTTRQWATAGFVLVLSVLPVMGLLVLLGAAPKFAPRYLLPASIGPLLALGAGLAALLALPRLGPVLAVGATVGLSASWLLLPGRTADAALADQSFRDAVATLEQEAGPEDAVIIVGGHAEADYRYYARQPRAVYPLPPGPLLDLDQPLADVAKLLDRVAAHHRRVWLLRWQDDLADPARNVLRLLEDYAEPLDFGREFAGVRLHGYDLAPGLRFADEPEIRFPQTTAFERGIIFLGYSTDRLAARPGETVGITLHWQLRERQSEDLWAFVHFLNAANQVYGQLDKRPVNDVFPMSRWPLDRTIVDPYWVQVPPGTPPGPYQIEIGLYREGGARLGTLDGRDHLLIGRLDVLPGALPLDAFTLTRQRAVLGPVELVGFDLDRTSVRPGERLAFRLFWRPLEPVTQSLRVATRLVTPNGATLLLSEAPPAGGTYPTDRWPVGEIVRDSQVVVIPPSARGDLRLEVGLRAEGVPLGPAWTPLATVLRASE
ncbi:MAG: hypothetical protein KatS3mg061_3191 [Dehalococcoidia bacterium]|nr:MAG: hypothetical protein KatS3mg061_3191 [Dehalococcoidia bacterium]